jgi:hypothetical protein
MGNEYEQHHDDATLRTARAHLHQHTTWTGMGSKNWCRVLVEYVLRQANGYFIYSTVEGVSIASNPGSVTNTVTWSCCLLLTLRLCSH